MTNESTQHTTRYRLFVPLQYIMDYSVVALEETLLTDLLIVWPLIQRADWVSILINANADITNDNVVCSKHRPRNKPTFKHFGKERRP